MTEFDDLVSGKKLYIFNFRTREKVTTLATIPDTQRIRGARRAANGDVIFTTSTDADRGNLTTYYIDATTLALKQ